MKGTWSANIGGTVTITVTATATDFPFADGEVVYTSRRFKADVAAEYRTDGGPSGVDGLADLAAAIAPTVPSFSGSVINACLSAAIAAQLGL